jgi:hypothetical protein
MRHEVEEVEEIKEVEEGVAEGNRKLKRGPSAAPRATASRWKKQNARLRSG